MDPDENLRMQCLHLAVSRCNAPNQGDYPERDAVNLAKTYFAFVSAPKTPVVASPPAAPRDDIPF